MQIQYLIAKARNTVTGVTVMHRDLRSSKFTTANLRLAEDFARQYAAKMTRQTGDTWRGYVEQYTPNTLLRLRSR